MVQQKIPRLTLRNKLKVYPGIPQNLNGKRYYYLSNAQKIWIYSENIKSKSKDLTKRSHIYLIKALEGYRKLK